MWWSGRGSARHSVLDEGARDARVEIVRRELEGAVERGRHGPKLPEFLIAGCDLLEEESIARIQLQRSLQAAGRFVPQTLAPVDVAGQFEGLRIIGKSALGMG